MYNGFLCRKTRSRQEDWGHRITPHGCTFAHEDVFRSCHACANERKLHTHTRTHEHSRHHFQSARARANPDTTGQTPSADIRRRTIARPSRGPRNKLAQSGRPQGLPKDGSIDGAERSLRHDAREAAGAGTGSSYVHHPLLASPKSLAALITGGTCHADYADPSPPPPDRSTSPPPPASPHAALASKAFSTTSFIPEGTLQEEGGRSVRKWKIICSAQTGRGALLPASALIAANSRVVRSCQPRFACVRDTRVYAHPS